jgi:acyl-CoA thioesterase-1
VFLVGIAAAAQSEDWANLARYRSEDRALAAPQPGEKRVVFMGDSITDGWGHGPTSAFFPGKPYVNRGISGQTTPQMLIRFRPDVVALKPAAVVILAGTNDLAGNTGPMTLEDTENNLMSMVDIARQNGIRVVLASVLPATAFPWHPGIQPAQKIKVLNAWIKDYAAANHLVYLGYYSSLVNDEGGMKNEFSKDGVHPNSAGYAVMAPLAEKAIAEALQ